MAVVFLALGFVGLEFEVWRFKLSGCSWTSVSGFRVSGFGSVLPKPHKLPYQ